MRVIGNETGDNYHVAGVDLAPHGVSVELDKVRVERRAFGNEPHLMRVESTGAKPRSGER